MGSASMQKFDVYHIHSVWENHNIKVFATTDTLAGQLAWLTIT